MLQRLLLFTVIHFNPLTVIKLTHQTYTLLVVEDCSIDRELYQRFLLQDSSCNYDLLEAESVVEGLELCQTKSIDVILLDYHLSNGDGLEFLTKLATQGGGRLPPVVMLTGQGDENIAVQAMKLGAQDYLVKSKLTSELLQLSIRNAISNGHFRQQLAQSEDRFRASMDNMIDCVGIYSAVHEESGQISDFQIDYLNLAALTDTLLTSADVGKKLCDVFPSVRDTDLFAKYVRVVETGMPLIKEDLIYKDVFGGQLLTRTYDLRVSKLHDGFICTWRDVTERKQIELTKIEAERDLREYQERLQTGIEVAGVALARFDYTTNLVALSPEAVAMYGFAPGIASVTRKQIHNTFHPDERAALEVTIAQVVDPQGTGWFAQDHRVVYPSGEVRCLSVRKQVFFDRSGAVERPSYAILAAIDVTDRNQTLADLEARNQDLDSFVHIVSHDLKAPLRAVANLSEWIEEDLADSLSVANQEQMSLLRNRVYRMESTIDGLLDYARLGRTEHTNELVIVAQLLSEIVDSLAPPPKFTISIAQNMPTFHTDRVLLSQVFANLIGNGIKHNNKLDGSIRIVVAEHRDYYEFAIADDGPGIAPEQQDLVFQIFHAVNPQKRADSTGIGLAIVKKIIETEGGTIRLESEIGKGTTFYFTWPMLVIPHRC
jgi:signal transduction histidine kinase/CheY-like chemotaxis protein